MRIFARHIVYALFAGLPLCATAGYGQEEPVLPRDSGKVFNLGGIVVTAERYPVSARKAGAVSFTIPGGSLAPFNGAGGALSAVRSLHIMSYGGGMALQTLSVRGMGAEHTLVLWNGMPAGNMQTGVSDINLFDASDLDLIQVVPGGASALYGSAAVGGAVNFVPSIPYGGGRSVDISAGAGSFGETDYAVKGEVSPDSSIGISVRAGTRRSSEEYPFGNGTPGGAETRKNSDYFSRALSVAGGWKISDRSRMGTVVSAQSLAQGAPGPWSPGTGPSGARRADTRTMASLSVEHHPSEALSLTLAGLFDRQYERFNDPGPLFPADDYYRTTWTGLTGQARYRASGVWLLQGGTDLNIATASGNEIDLKRSRQTAALTGAASFEFRPLTPVTATITPSGRLEWSSVSTPRLSPKLGVNLETGGDESSVRLHASAGSGRRSPTMNELFFTGVGGRGNPSLKDESSVSIDAGIGGRGGLGGVFSWDVTWYRIRLTERILWAPTEDPWTWSPQNIGRSLSTGWEFSAEWAPLPGELEFQAGYSIMDARRGDISSDGTMSYEKQLIYIPLNIGMASVLIGGQLDYGWLRSMSVVLRAVRTGERYTLEDNSASLPAHLILEATATVEFTTPGGTAMAVYSPHNLGNVDYQELPGYPMPRFHHSVSITYRIRY